MSAPGQPSLLEPEQEHDLEASRPGPQKIEHGHAPGLRCRCPSYVRTFERCHDFLGRDGTIELAPSPQLAEQAHDGVVRANVMARRLADRRGVESVGRAQHRAGQTGDRVERRRRGPQLLEHPERLSVAQADRLLFDLLGPVDGAPAQAPL